MTRDDHKHRITQVIADAEDAARTGVGLKGIAACVGMAPSVLTSFLTRYGRHDLIPTLRAHDNELDTTRGPLIVVQRAVTS